MRQQGVRQPIGVRKPGRLPWFHWVREQLRLNPLARFSGSAALIAGLFSALAFAAPAKTGLVFCNRGVQGRVHVAIAHPTGQDRWASEGWLHLDQGQCETAVPGKLNNRFYYYFAETDRDYTWQGDQPFCVSSQQFAFVDATTECKGDSSRWVKFRELDTGKDSDSYTLNLE